MNCSNCKQEIISPVEHEFCQYRAAAMWLPKRIGGPFLHSEQVEFGGQPPHYPKKESVPIQHQIKHNAAAKGARPPMDSGDHFHSYGDITDGAQDLASKIVEENG